MASVETQKMASTNPSESLQINEGVKNSLEQLFSKIFSKESSCEFTTYFQPLLNASHELPIESIVKAPCVRSILSDDEQLKNAILTSKSFHVWNDMVRSSVPVKLEQNTLILRDISSVAPSGDIIGIFTSAVSVSGQPGPSPQSVRSDMNDTWFVTFSSEENAKAALAAIKDSKYNDKPVKARLKTESSVKSYFSVPAGGNNPLQLNTDLHQQSSSGPNSVVSTPTAGRAHNQVPLSSSGAGAPPPPPLNGGAPQPQDGQQFVMGPPPPMYGNPALFFPAGYPVPPPPLQQQHQHQPQFMHGAYPMQPPLPHQQLTPQQHLLMQQQQQQLSAFPMQMMPVHPPGSMLPMLTHQQMQHHQQQAFMYMQANPAAAAAYLAMQQQQQIGGAPFVINPQMMGVGGVGMGNASPQQPNGKGGNYNNNLSNGNNNNNNNARRDGNKFSNGGRSGGNGGYTQQGGRNGSGQPYRSYNNNQQHQQQRSNGANGSFQNYNSQGASPGQSGGAGGPFVMRSYSADSQGSDNRQGFHTQGHAQQQQQYQQSFNRSHNIAPAIAVPSSSSGQPVATGLAVASDSSSDVTDVSKQTSSSGSGATGSRSPKPRQADGPGSQARQSSNNPKQQSNLNGNRPPVQGVVPTVAQEVPAAEVSSKPSAPKDVKSSVPDTVHNAGEGSGRKSSGGEGSPRPRQPTDRRDGAVKGKEGGAPAAGNGKDKRGVGGARDVRGKREGGDRDARGGPAAGQSHPAKKAPAVEFNMEADFPILIDHEGGALPATKSAPAASSVWGQKKLVVGAPETAPVVKATTTTPSVPKGRGSKGGAKDNSVKPSPPVQVEVISTITAAPGDVQVAAHVITKSTDAAPEPNQRRQEPPQVFVAAVSVEVPVVAAVPTEQKAAVERVSAPVPVVIQIAGLVVPSAAVVASSVIVSDASVPAPSPSQTDETSSPSVWGAKKSFVDILRHAPK